MVRTNEVDGGYVVETGGGRTIKDVVVDSGEHYGQKRKSTTQLVLTGFCKIYMTVDYTIQVLWTDHFGIVAMISHLTIWRCLQI